MNNALKSVMLVGTGIIIGALLFSKCGHEPIKPNIVPIKKIQDNLADKNKPLEKKIDSLAKENSQLKQKTATIAQQLTKERRSLKMAENALNEIINTAPDTVVQFVADYVEHSNTADSLCTELVALKDSQLVVKDSAIAAKDSLYSTLKNSFNFSLNQNQILIDYTKWLKKEMRKGKAAKFVWKAAAIVAGALFIKQSLK